MRGRYVVRVTPADVGQRVTLRARLVDAPGGATAAGATPSEPTTTDTVGRLLAWEDDRLHVELRDGRRVIVAADELVAGRVIPEQRR